MSILSLNCGDRDVMSPDPGRDTNVSHQEVFMECINLVSLAEPLQMIINSQEEYDQLYLERFQQPLDDYWQDNYDAVLQRVKEEHPGLTEEEYEELVKEVFYKAYPFWGTDNCNRPQIDFNSYTLLGQQVFRSGCSADFRITVTKDEENKKIFFDIRVEEHGTCEPWVPVNKWILIRKISSAFTVEFNTSTSRT